MRTPLLAYLTFLTVLAGRVAAQTDAPWEKLEAKVKADALDFMAWNQMTAYALGRVQATGRLEWIDRAATAADASLKAVIAELNPGAVGFRSRVDLAQHRFKAALVRAREWKALQPEKPGARALEFDALLEIGDLESATRAIEELSEAEGDSLLSHPRSARLAYLKGDPGRAREHWEAVVELLKQDPGTPKSMVAWCWVQIGEFHFRAGRWMDAESAYQNALNAVPDWWSAIDHLAELRAAQGKDAEAIELFTKVAKATERPEIWQALGDYHLFAKRPAEAKAAHERALAGYRTSIDKGEILYVHHLAGFFSDSQEDAAEAVKWARKDLEQRQGPQAWDVLAWAVYRAKDFPAAKEAMLKALASGIADTHILYHAAMIHMSSGDVIEGQRLLRRCAEVNPHFNAFHVHR